MDVGREIRRARHAAGLSQAELGELSGTSQATLSAYESGTKKPSAATLERVLAACGARLTAVPATRAVRSPSRDRLAERGRTLAAVLDLAGRLPSKHSAALRFPSLRATGHGQ